MDINPSLQICGLEHQRNRSWIKGLGKNPQKSKLIHWRQCLLSRGTEACSIRLRETVACIHIIPCLSQPRVACWHSYRQNSQKTECVHRSAVKNKIAGLNGLRSEGVNKPSEWNHSWDLRSLYQETGPRMVACIPHQTSCGQATHSKSQNLEIRLSKCFLLWIKWVPTRLTSNTFACIFHIKQSFHFANSVSKRHPRHTIRFGQGKAIFLSKGHFH